MINYKELGRRRPTVGGGESMVREAFKDEADINRIVARYQVTGQLPLTKKDARYGDVSDVRDYKASLDFVREATRDIDELPEGARKQFLEGPAAFMAELELAETREQLVGLGILADPEKPAKPVVAPTEPAVEG